MKQSMTAVTPKGLPGSVPVRQRAARRPPWNRAPLWCVCPQGQGSCWHCHQEQDHTPVWSTWHEWPVLFPVIRFRFNLASLFGVCRDVVAASRHLTRNYCSHKVAVMWTGKNFEIWSFDVGKGRRSGPARDELVRPRGGAYYLEEVVLLIN